MNSGSEALARDMRILSSGEMAALEMNAEYFGVSTLQLMENAGGAVAREIAKRFVVGSGVTIFAGTGGNGGDGMVAARHLSCLGYEVSLVLVGSPSDIRREIVRRNWEAVTFMADSIKTVVAEDSALIPKVEGKVAVAALVGTGARGPLRHPVSDAVRILNGTSCFKVAIDIPAGVDPDTGQVFGEAFRADLTVTFHGAKRGLLEAKRNVGELLVTDIGLPREAETYVGPGDVLLARKPRPYETHKGDYGRVLVIGGSETFSGAPYLAAMAALRTGVDIVYVAAPADTAHDIASMSPALITIKLKGDHLSTDSCDVLADFIEKSSAVVIGPGLGLHKETVVAVRELIGAAEKSKVPLLMDADALKAFAEFKHRVDSPLVFTPHGGEFQILTGRELPKELEDRVELVRATGEELNATILLKGPVDVVSDGKRVKLNRVVHNPGMTVGGTGDVLSGIVGALLSQGFDPFRAAVSGIFINGAAGDFAAHEKGYHLLPTDIIEWIPNVMDDPMSHAAVRRVQGS